MAKKPIPKAVLEARLEVAFAQLLGLSIIYPIGRTE